MNRQKSAPRVHSSTYLTLIGTAIIAACGGILHVDYKNRQIKVNREIDAIEHRIEQYQLDIQTTQMRSDNLLDRYVIQDQLEASGSSLRPIPVGLAEEITATPPSAVAVVTP